MEKKESSQLVLCGATISFVFTFGLTTNRLVFPPVGQIDADAIRDGLRSADARDVWRVGYGTPDNDPGSAVILWRRGVLPWLALSDESDLLYAQAKPLPGLATGPSGVAEMEHARTFRLSSTGAGTYTLSVRLPMARNLSSAWDFLALLPEGWGHPTRHGLAIDGGSGPTKFATLHDVFEREVQCLISAVNDSGALRGVKQGLHGVAKLARNDTRMLLPPASCGGVQQAPYVVTVLEFDPETYSSLFSADSRATSEDERSFRADAHRQLAALLLGVLRPRGGNQARDLGSILRTALEETHWTGERNNEGRFRLRNENMMALPFVATHARSCLVGCLSLEGASETVMIPSLFDLLELSRLQWHCFVMAECALDQMMEKLREASMGESADAGGGLASDLDALVWLRTKLTLMERSIAGYRWGGNSLRDMSARVDEQFGTSAIRATCLRKLDLLEKTYGLILERKWRVRGT